MSSSDHMFRALRNRNYRLFFFGQGISVVGTWMQQVALSWLIYSMTHSEFLLGLTAFASQAPTFLLTPLAGTLADRVNRYRLLMVVQALAMIQAFVLAWFTFSGHIQISHIIVLGVFLGIITALDVPTRQSFMVELVEDRKDLANAIALSSTLQNVARLLGPALAGGLIAWLGEGLCFLLNGISYIAVLFALAAMKIRPHVPAAHTSSILSHFKEGLQYSSKHLPIRAILIFVSVLGFAGYSYSVLVPVFAKDILHGGADTLGLLLGASGFGAFLSAVLLARRKQVVGLGQWILRSSVVFGLGLILLMFVQSLWLAMIVFGFVGFGMMMQLGASNIILQTLVDEDKRGRVMGLFTMAILGMSPIGSLIVGWAAEHIGVPRTFLICGVICLITGFILQRKMPEIRKAAHPIFIAKGLIEDIPIPLAVHKIDSSESSTKG